jgi:hypothetical protein
MVRPPLDHAEFVRTTEDSAVAAALSVEVDGWNRELGALMQRIGGCFARVETWRTARDAVDGLLADLPRKNCWSLAEHAGHGSPDRLQHLLSRASWDDAAVRGEVAAYVTQHLTAGVEDGLVTLVFDETGDAKKGRQTVGVQRQYSGTCGRIENCQLAVFATLATPAGHAFIDVELYLPQSWTSDPDRCAAAGVPDDVEFSTKPQLALRMADRALAAGILPGWIAADEAYGDNPELRHALEERGLNYVMAVSCDTQIPTPTGKIRADTLAGQIPHRGWQILSAGKGSKGERLYQWAHTPASARPAPANKPQATGGCSSAATPSPVNWPTSCATRPPAPGLPPWSGWPAPAGVSRRTSKPAKDAPDWTNTRLAPGPPGSSRAGLVCRSLGPGCGDDFAGGVGEGIGGGVFVAGDVEGDLLQGP